MHKESARQEGVRTRFLCPEDRGDINRKIHEANRVLRENRNKINGLKEWIAALNDAMKELVEEDQSPALSDLMLQYLEVALSDVKEKSDSVRQSLHTKEKQMKELQKLIERGEQYREKVKRIGYNPPSGEESTGSGTA